LVKRDGKGGRGTGLNSEEGTEGVKKKTTTVAYTATAATACITGGKRPNSEKARKIKSRHRLPQQEARKGTNQHIRKGERRRKKPEGMSVKRRTQAILILLVRSHAKIKRNKQGELRRTAEQTRIQRHIPAAGVNIDQLRRHGRSRLA